MDKAMEDKAFNALVAGKRLAAWANVIRVLAWAAAAGVLTLCGWAALRQTPGIGTAVLTLGIVSAIVALCDFGGNLKETLIGFLKPEAGVLSDYSSLSDVTLDCD